jgi:hypothetical protein
VVGIDLSLTRSAAFYLPSNWKPGGSWAKVKTITVGYPLSKTASATQRDLRIRTIVKALVAFLNEVPVGTRPDIYVTPTKPMKAEWSWPAVYVEDYAYGLAGNSGIRLAELGGALKYAIAQECGVSVEPINMTTARKIFLGKIPKGKGAAQVAVHSTLKRMGFAYEGSDEGDAFVIANAGRSLLGMTAATIGV